MLSSSCLPGSGDISTQELGCTVRSTSDALDFYVGRDARDRRRPGKLQGTDKGPEKENTRDFRKFQYLPQKVSVAAAEYSNTCLRRFQRLYGPE